MRVVVEGLVWPKASALVLDAARLLVKESSSFVCRGG